MKRIDYIAIHCSASPATHDWGVADLRRMHRAQGWRDVGYHYVIKRDGTLEKGRLDTTPGAHEPRINRCSLAICMIGGSPPTNTPAFRKGLGEDNFTDAQWVTLKTAVTKLHKLHPAAEVLGHRDVQGVNKACPSFDVRTWWASNKP
jgi:N-acetylmuramoyl-L-alanine amidase